MRVIVLSAVAIVVILAGAAFLLTRGGGAMSEPALIAYLSDRAADINATADGERFDDFSRLVQATAVQRQITIRGRSILNADALPENYLDSRRAQAARQLCGSDIARSALAGGASYVYNWFSADDGDLGMVAIQGDAVCAEYGF